MKNPDERYLEKIKELNFDPVFILGLHRSGTSILYKMLTSTDCFNPVTAYNIIYYEELISNYLNKKEEYVKNNLTKYIRSKGQENRGIDTLKINADFAEEYGFLLGKYSSTYYITAKNVRYFKRLAKKIQFISDNDKPLLLKNPWDLPHFLTIKKLIPNAKFIFIHRHPYKTLSSFVKATKSIMKKENFYTSILYPDYKKTIENPLLKYGSKVLFSDYTPFGTLCLIKLDAKGVNYYIKNISTLHKEDYVEVTYESLCSTPNETIKTILDSLNIETNNIDVSSFINPRNTELDPDIKTLNRFVFHNMKNYFNKFEYNPSI